MSKIGKKIIKLPKEVQVQLSAGKLVVKGPKGQLELTLDPVVQVTAENQEIKVAVSNPNDRRQVALWGTFRALINNLVIGVTAGFQKRLEIFGVGYKAAVAASKLVLNLGYSHPIEIEIPKSLEVKVEKNAIAISGMNKQEVGEFAALVRSQREPEPYKGKGIRYQGEVVRRKAGKVVKAVGAG